MDETTSLYKKDTQRVKGSRRIVLLVGLDRILVELDCILVPPD